MVQGTVADVNGLGTDAPAELQQFLTAGFRYRRNAPVRNLVPQLGHHPVRRPRAHRHAGDHRLGGHRPGGGRRRACSPATGGAAGSFPARR